MVAFPTINQVFSCYSLITFAKCFIDIVNFLQFILMVSDVGLIKDFKILD